MSIDIKQKYKKKIDQLAKELAAELLQNEESLENRFASFDSEVHKILMDIGKKRWKQWDQSSKKK